MCLYPYPVMGIEIDELENQLIEQDRDGLNPSAWRLCLQISSFDDDEMNLLKLYTDENDEIDTILCIEDYCLIGYCLIESF